MGQAVHDIQKNLFIIQAELAGASMSIDEEKIKEIEIIIDSIEKELPPIKTFFISGGTELATLFDISRTISRRAERRVVEVKEENKVSVKESTLAYLNRLSSLLYAFARLVNHKAGITEKSPDYK
jgi:cob(I)alamin adenosyltransferase